MTQFWLTRQEKCEGFQERVSYWQVLQEIPSPLPSNTACVQM